MDAYRQQAAHRYAIHQSQQQEKQYVEWQRQSLLDDGLILEDVGQLPFVHASNWSPSFPSLEEKQLKARWVYKVQGPDNRWWGTDIRHLWRQFWTRQPVWTGAAGSSCQLTEDQILAFQRRWLHVGDDLCVTGLLTQPQPLTLECWGTPPNAADVTLRQGVNKASSLAAQLAAGVTPVALPHAMWLEAQGQVTPNQPFLVAQIVPHRPVRHRAWAVYAPVVNPNHTALPGFCWGSFQFAASWGFVDGDQCSVQLVNVPRPLPSRAHIAAVWLRVVTAESKLDIDAIRQSLARHRVLQEEQLVVTSEQVFEVTRLYTGQPDAPRRTRVLLVADQNVSVDFDPPCVWARTREEVLNIQYAGGYGARSQ